jgi:predicted peptidase
VIGVEETDLLVEALKKEGCPDDRLRYIRYETSTDSSAKDWMVGHNCWDKTYSDRSFWQWMLSFNNSSSQP